MVSQKTALRSNRKSREGRHARTRDGRRTSERDVWPLARDFSDLATPLDSTAGRLTSHMIDPLRHRHRSQRCAGHLTGHRLHAWVDDASARVRRHHRRARGRRARHHARAARCQLRQRLRRVGLQPANEVADVVLSGAAHRRLAHLHTQGVLVQSTRAGYTCSSVVHAHVQFIRPVGSRCASPSRPRQGRGAGTP